MKKFNLPLIALIILVASIILEFFINWRLEFIVLFGCVFSVVLSIISLIKKKALTLSIVTLIIGSISSLILLFFVLMTLIFSGGIFGLS